MNLGRFCGVNHTWSRAATPERVRKPTDFHQENLQQGSLHSLDNITLLPLSANRESGFNFPGRVAP